MEQTFEQLYQDSYQKLYTLAFRLSGNREEAEDILQTSFMKAYKSYGSFEKRSSIQTWLYRIVVNTSRSFWKSSRKLPVTISSEENGISELEVYNSINSLGESENDILSNQVRESCLQMFINCMPPKYRAIYTTRIILHFTVAECAEILDISEGSVKTGLSRAKSIMRDHYKGRCSLIQPGSPCNCRSYAKYIETQNMTHGLVDMKVVRQKERESTKQYSSELKEILEIKSFCDNDIESLYDTNSVPIDYKLFLNRVKEISLNGSCLVPR